jgi:putative flippase GtrA
VSDAGALSDEPTPRPAKGRTGRPDQLPPQLPQPVELPVADLVSPFSLTTQLTRFVITGALSAVVDFGLLVIGMAAGLSHTPAKALSFVAGTTTAYLINRRWTFRAAPSAARVAAGAVLYGVTFALQVGLFSLLYTLSVRHALPQIAAQTVAFVIAQGVATAVNFAVQRWVIFRLR